MIIKKKPKAQKTIGALNSIFGMVKPLPTTGYKDPERHLKNIGVSKDAVLPFLTRRKMFS